MHSRPNRFTHVALSLSILLAVAAVLGIMISPPAWGATERNLVVNGDFARTYPARPSPAPVVRNSPTLGKDSQLPCAWVVEPNRWPQGSQENIGTVVTAQADGKSALHVTTGKGESMRLRQSIEVVPEASYTCFVWVKGKGSVAMMAYAQRRRSARSLGPAACRPRRLGRSSSCR